MIGKPEAIPASLFNVLCQAFYSSEGLSWLRPKTKFHESDLDDGVIRIRKASGDVIVSKNSNLTLFDVWSFEQCLMGVVKAVTHSQYTAASGRLTGLFNCP
ncbi:MAG: hypothetical protein ACJAYE_002173 [Candidatus Azotimanducaceae bacterium]|jgi:hypothetical protein